MAQHLAPRTMLASEKRDIKGLSSASVAEAFWELFELLEEYAPVWYTEQRRNRAMAVAQMLDKSVKLTARGQRSSGRDGQGLGLSRSGSRASNLGRR